jgi:hypothetical protein
VPVVGGREGEEEEGIGISTPLECEFFGALHSPIPALRGLRDPGPGSVWQ